MTEHSAVAVAPACLRLLGGWDLLVDGAGVGLGHREQRLVALLGLTDIAARAQVASILWPESTDEHALGSLRRAVRQCHTRCPGVIDAARLTVGLAAAVRVDVDDLRRAAGLTRLPMGDRSAHELLDAVRGPELLPGWYDDWVVDERTRLEQLRVEALERISLHGLQQGDFELAIEASGAASAIEPLRESAREMAIRGHLGREDTGSALHELQRYRAVMDEELGVAPSARIQALLEPTLDTPVPERNGIVPRQRTAPPEEVLTMPPPVSLDEWLEGKPTGGRPSSGARRAGVALVGAAGLALAVALAVAAAGPDPRRPATTDPGEGAGLVSPLGDPGDSGTAAGPQPTRTVRVRLVDSVAGSAAFAVRATPLPAAVRLVVRGPAGLRVVRHVVVRAADGRQVVVDGLDPGTYRWSATSASAGQVGGEVSVTPAPVADDVRDDDAPDGGAATVAPVAETPSQAPTLSPQPSPHPTPSPRPRPRRVPPLGRPRRPVRAELPRTPGPSRPLRWAEEGAMSDHPFTWRGLVARLVALILSAGCLAVAAPGAASFGAVDAVAGGSPHRWSGYRIAVTGDAAGGWIGGYRVGRTELYLTTPTRRPNRSGFRAPQQLGDLPGRRASRPETARAAWILSKYGAYRDATQAAAVDATVYHLLVGGAWRIDSRRGARRIRQSGDPAGVERFARIMLRQSRHRAGAYSASLAVSGADVGGAVAVTLSVVDGHGRPAPGLPVTLRMSGTEPRSAVTGDDGRAVARFSADVRGWQEVVAEVSHVPEHRLRVWGPERRAQAAAAEGGVARTVVVSTMTPVRGPQTLSLAADPGQLVVGTSARVVATVSGDGTDRTATAALHGPFTSAAGAHCSGPSVGQVSARVAGDGSYALPPVTPSSGGYFAWRVAVDGTDTSLPVTSCGAPVKVRARTTLAVAAPVAAAQYDVISAQVTVAGLPFGGPVDITTALYGPYTSAADACTGNHREVTQRRPGNGTFTSQSFQVDQPGWYAWRASMPEGDLWLGSTSACGVVGANGSVVSVQ